MSESGGVVLELFDGVDDFVGRATNPGFQDSDRVVKNGHDLAVVVLAVVEALSRANLSQVIVGFSTESEGQLVQERRRLEDTGSDEPLQRFLFTTESIYSIVRKAGYGAIDASENTRFFSLFSTWLERLQSWATAREFTPLAQRLERARTGYDAIVHQDSWIPKAHS